MSERDSRPTSAASNQRLSRKPPRADRREPLGCFVRCRLCDWQLIGAEGTTTPRACCPEGLRFDLDHGLTPDGLGQWHASAEPPTLETKDASNHRPTLRDALYELVIRCQMVKRALNYGLPDGSPVHPQSAALTWPVSSALLALELDPETKPARLATDEIRDLSCCDSFVREAASEFCAECGYTNVDHLRRRAENGSGVVAEVMPSSFTSLLALPDNWDSYGARRIDERWARKAFEIWRQLAGTWTPVPHSDGSVGLERHADGFDIEIDIQPIDELPENGPSDSGKP